jgi:hypothetical protein
MKKKLRWFSNFMVLMSLTGILWAQTPTPTTPALRSYEVQEGDTLWDIAGAFLKRPYLWPELLKFNDIKNPNLILPGQVFLIPQDKVLEDIKDKSELEIKTEKEKLEGQATPVIVESLPQAPQSVVQVATPNVAVTSPPLPGVSALPTPEKTPTLKVTGSKTINISYGQSLGSGVTGITNLGFNRHETLKLNLEGQLNDEVKISGHYSQSDLDLEDEYDLTVSSKHWEGYFGNFGISLAGSQYLSSGMSSTGVRLKGSYDSWNIEALYGTPRGRIVYDKFYGNTTQGPYTLSAIPITPGTETITVNKQTMNRGTDYQIDYTLGQIILKNRTLLPTDLMEVQYQSRSALFNTEDYGYHMNFMLLGKKDEKGVKWSIGQGYLRQEEQPDPGITTATARAAADTHMFDLDSTLDLGSVLKLSGEAAYSVFISSDNSITPSERGGAYRLQADSFDGPFHFMGKYAKTDPSFSTIGNPVVSADYQQWSLFGDFKPSERFYAEGDTSFQRSNAAANDDETRTEHGEVKMAPLGWPSFHYSYYQTNENQGDVNGPLHQQSLKHNGDISFPLPAKILLSTGVEYSEQNGTNSGDIRSRGGNLSIATDGWKGFNFSLSGDWKLNDVLEAGANTLTPQTQPGDNIFSQTYTLAMEGKPVDHLSFTAKGLYSSDPPGPPRTNVSAGYQTDPFKWLTSSGNYTLEFDRRQVLTAVSTTDQIHSASAGLDVSLFPWWKLSAQPSLRVEVLQDYDQEISESLHQGYRSLVNPADIGSLNVDYSNDRFRNWDTSTPGFPLLFIQSTEVWNISGKKGLFPNLALTGGYKRTDQSQVNYAAMTVTSQTKTLNQVENDALDWEVSKVFGLNLSHSYCQLDQDSPGQGNATNPLLPYGPDTFSSTFSTNNLNIATRAHTFTLRVTEQLMKDFSFYEEGGYTGTWDGLSGGYTATYSPGTGFTWKASSFINWTASYQFNGSEGQVSTVIQKGQTTLSASLNPQTSLALNWGWSQANNPNYVNQQGNLSFTTNF